MTKERSEEQLAAGRVAQRLLVDQMGRASLPLIVLFVVGIVVGFQEGFTTRGAAFLYGGVIVSVLTTLFYSLPTLGLILGEPKMSGGGPVRRVEDHQTFLVNYRKVA